MWTQGKMHANWPSRYWLRQMPQRSTRTPTTLSFCFTLPDDDTRRCSSSTRPTGMLCSSSCVSDEAALAGPRNSPRSVAHSYCIEGLSSCATATSRSVTEGACSGEGGTVVSEPATEEVVVGPEGVKASDSEGMGAGAGAAGTERGTAAGAAAGSEASTETGSRTGARTVSWTGAPSSTPTCSGADPRTGTELGTAAGSVDTVGMTGAGTAGAAGAAGTADTPGTASGTDAGATPGTGPSPATEPCIASNASRAPACALGRAGTGGTSLSRGGGGGGARRRGRTGVVRAAFSPCAASSSREYVRVGGKWRVAAVMVGRRE